MSAFRFCSPSKSTASPSRGSGISVIPDNVAAAVNFYQPHGLIHGRSEIKAEDGSKTQILGNYRFDYRQHPVQCEATSWFDRTFTPSHMQSQCDPQIWNRVDESGPRADRARSHLGGRSGPVALRYTFRLGKNLSYARRAFPQRNLAR